MIESMLTTVDNPYSPFEQYEEWYTWDRNKGYHTPEFLARIAIVSDELSPSDYMMSIEYAIDEIVKENVLGLYKKITRETTA